jgi:hypothetical protein
MKKKELRRQVKNLQDYVRRLELEKDRLVQQVVCKDWFISDLKQALAMARADVEVFEVNGGDRLN